MGVAYTIRLILRQSPVTDSTLQARYQATIEDLLVQTLQGKIRSPFQIYDRLVQEFETGSEELFEQCLSECDKSIKVNAESDDEMKQAKAIRRGRALKTIQSEWKRYQGEQSRKSAIATALSNLLSATPENRLSLWLTTFDPNSPNRLTLDQQQQLSQQLKSFSSKDSDWGAIAQGIDRGLESWKNLELNLVQWMFTRSTTLGFGSEAEAGGPWKLWAAEVKSAVPRSLFELMNARDVDFSSWQETVEDGDWVELAIVLLTAQRGLVSWAETQPYNSKGGRQLCISTFLTFTVLWSQLSGHFAATRPTLQNASFQIVLQTLRSFAQKSYFPLYGGMVAMLSQGSFNDLLTYLDEPLRRVDKTQEKARILTLIGYSQQVMRHTDSAIAFHEQALEIAQSEELAVRDLPCAIANLNHLSRAQAAAKNYAEALRFAQQALILARQSGDSLGQANALANVGYSEILSARQLDRLDEDSAEIPISQLTQGLKLASTLDDRASQALCNNSLGIAYGMLGFPDRALPYLSAGFQAAQESGDRYLQGLNLTYFSEAQAALGDTDSALLSAVLAMYTLEQIDAIEWQQSRNWLLLLRGRLGDDDFGKQMKLLRPRILASIGVDGYDHALTLLV